MIPSIELICSFALAGVGYSYYETFRYRGIRGGFAKRFFAHYDGEKLIRACFIRLFKMLDTLKQDLWEHIQQTRSINLLYLFLEVVPLFY